ncbi:cytochrome c1 [Albimonas pacifica]|uniref:Cytochrome c1 n=1 Tax=Albimonas pacifica TaxID=1114924 RepID=A0A1I3BTQ0_9RHOB|nr:cytochrome c1 [Albimonas pacifica]SFH65684.1 ubiquinol-cytochrome c reductase cytochrome c1 subunit [Albimonas pacifica]
MRILTAARFAGLVAAGALALPLAASAAEGGGHITDVSYSFEGPLGSFDQAQLQRGLQVYNEVCSACHGLKFVAFRTLGDPTGPGYDDAQVAAMAGLYQVADTSDEALPGDTRTAVASDKFPPNDAVGAPDLSLMAKARAGFHGPYGTGISQLVNGIGGPEYIYSILTHYTGETQDVAGVTLYENETMAGGLISMAPPLSDDIVEYADGTPATVEQMAKDVSAFLMWTAEPKLADRKAAGARNFIFVGLLAVLLYLTNKKLWATVKKKKAA